MLAIKNIGLELKSIDAFHTTKIHTVMSRRPGCFMKGINTTLLAEIMLGRFGTKLVKTQHAVFGINSELVSSNDIS